MKILEKQERAKKLLKQMSDVFYDVVPETYKTYCVLVSSIAKFALQANGLDAKLTVCQLWYQLNGRRFTPKWLVRDEGSVICAYRYDWQGNVRCSDFARVVRIVGAMATRGYQWLEQADDAARRYKEEQVQEQGEASADDRAATKPDAAESGATAKRSNKILH